MVALKHILAAATLAFGTLAQPLSARDTKHPTVSSIGDPTVVSDNGVYMRVTRHGDALIAGYMQIAGGNETIKATRSDDQGKTWKDIAVVQTLPGKTDRLDNAFAYSMPDGRVLMSFRHHSKDDKGNYNFYRIVVWESTDDGKTWKFLSTIQERPQDGTARGIWEPFLRVDNKGNLQAYWSDEYLEDDQDTALRISKDGGKTWEKEVAMVTGYDRKNNKQILGRDGMVSIIQIKGDHLMMTFESTADGPMAIYAIESFDDGYTWPTDTRRIIYKAAGGKSTGAPNIAKVGGAVVVNFGSDEDAALGWAQFVITSGDGGKSWGKAAVAFKGDAHWAGLFGVSDSEFLMSAQLEGGKLVSQRWKVDGKKKPCSA